MTTAATSNKALVRRLSRDGRRCGAADTRLSSNAIGPNPTADAIAPSPNAAAALELAATSLASGRNLALPVFGLILKFEECA